MQPENNEPSLPLPAPLSKSQQADWSLQGQEHQPPSQHGMRQPAAARRGLCRRRCRLRRRQQQRSRQRGVLGGSRLQKLQVERIISRPQAAQQAQQAPRPCACPAEAASQRGTAAGRRSEGPSVEAAHPRDDNKTMQGVAGKARLALVG
jgi:hypothetical protein